MKDLKKYFADLNRLFERISVTGAEGKSLSVNEAFKISLEIIKNKIFKGGKIMLIGNGGSSAIASHIAADLLKNANLPALALNDASFLTCISNDLGYEQVFAKPLSILGNAADILIAISSSGRSTNILKAIDTAKKNALTVITLSGFDKDNPLRKSGEINFYVPSKIYGFVEIAHLAICHYLADAAKIKFNA